MFFKIVSKNSRRSRKENGLFFASLLISVIAFYMILSMSGQDVMLFLKDMESDAVNRLLSLIPVFYGMTLVILFFLIYYASKFQLERRRHEFGMYLMLGMRRGRLFAMLLAEDIRNSLTALLIGLPASVLLSEVVSLVTARCVGLGIIGHQFSFSLYALVWTVAGFLAVKTAAFLILSGRISRQEIDTLLREMPEGTKKQRAPVVYILAFTGGVICLGAAYTMAIRGTSWQQAGNMGLTLLLGFAGTLLLFYGLRSVIVLFIKTKNAGHKLKMFNFRQLQETVIHKSASLAVSSLLILAALCFFGAGTAAAGYYRNSEPHVLDYTFQNYEEEDAGKGAEAIRKTLKAYHLDTKFSDLIEMKVGYIRTTEDFEHAFAMDSCLDAIRKLPQSESKDRLLNNLSYTGYPYLISLSGYNQLLRAAGEPELKLQKNEAAVYMDSRFLPEEAAGILNKILKEQPRTSLDGADLYLTGKVQTTALVTDRSITLSFALILPDDVFSYYTKNQYNIYLNGILDREGREETSLMNAIYDMNQKLSQTGLAYESYLQNMGRQLFYVVASGYITIYLAIIFLIVANTVIGVQFLMGQQKTAGRYKTLIRLGAAYDTLCGSAKRQINWYFGLPTIVAAVSSLFGVRALFSGLLSGSVKGSIQEFMLVSLVMILVLCVVECIYMAAVKRSACRYLLTLMEPQREE
ncbi:FtsX-like permease family [uncultured Roseburia sp.]|uniref:ABC transporter permease n=1 Tax=Brotonthovivens ammoniilytica TaxID=2981725 RepID=A0ABT2TLW2_9FIRM|nr:FtsX-like permease family protein [Brotonthovivens ammoniilytica]MCU6763203.1 ABC transporter permease [Brotonthovivens ammoniilytica]SCJ06643.1 FtsX-like permease family [uncultured Roseburia sp.]